MNKLFLIFSALLAVISLARETLGKDVKTFWMDQKLDHFNSANAITWKMRYLSNDQFYEAGGPLFIYVGGEWSVSSDHISEGTHIYDMAKEHNGHLFYTEHRYYGRSRIFSAATTKHLEYLQAQQALADLAYFIRTIKATKPGMENSKVILTGCSYAGSLVTWLKVIYPDLVAGGWASSAPLYAKADFDEHNELLGEAFRQLGGDACYNRIKTGFDKFEYMLANNHGAEVKAKLRLCPSFNEYNEKDVGSLFNRINDVFAKSIREYGPNGIQQACAKIMKGYNHVSGLADFILEGFGNEPCLDFSYSTYVDLLRNPSFNDFTYVRLWTYQTCSEFGWFRTSSSPRQPFGTKYSADFFYTLCTDLYGAKFTKNYIISSLQETNIVFGGFYPNVKNIYWTNGGMDPWRGVGKEDGPMATTIPDVFHCGDLTSISSADSPELKASKERISALVRSWLA